MADTPQRPVRWRQIALHATRVLIFALILLAIHGQYRQFSEQRRLAAATQPTDLKVLREFFPTAAKTTALDAKTLTAGTSQAGTSHTETGGAGGRTVLDHAGEPLGTVLKTSPLCDDLVGFSGPTNTLIAIDSKDKILGIKVLSSEDTRSHVQQVVSDSAFMTALVGLSPQQATEANIVDAVSGATLTSLAIQEAISQRLLAASANHQPAKRPQKSLRFPEPLTVELVQPLFPAADSVKQDENLSSRWEVLADSGEPLGFVLRTTPYADNMIGYQGPTETLVGVDPTEKVSGIWIGKSYDNQPYVSYVAEDEYGFLILFNDRSLAELAEMDLEAEGIEGVSGATMTSMAVANGLKLAAKKFAEDSAQQATELATTSPGAVEEQKESKSWIATVAPRWSWRDLGTGCILVAGIVVAFTSLRGKKRVRIALQVALIVYLGFINGDLLSQAMLVGWAQSGVPWTKAGGLVLLTVAAFAVPITTGKNIYCSHLCPHGAAQQLLKNRLPWQAKLPKRLTAAFKVLPAVLITWCVVVPLAALPFSLIDIEPFDAYVFRVAGWATITVAIVGLVASLFVPMAYCRFGCPTGTLLGFLRLHGRSDQWGRRDWLAVGLLGLAVGLYYAI